MPHAVIESSKVVTASGIVHVTKGYEIDPSRVIEVKTPEKALQNYQIAGYPRAFLADRTGWSALNRLLIISGAFGMLRNRGFIAADGCAHGAAREEIQRRGFEPAKGERAERSTPQRSGKE